MMKFNKSINYITFLGVMLSLACILYYIEALFLNPLTSLPGSKLGIANIITLLTIYWIGLKEGLIISFLRVILVNILLGGIFGLSFFLSLTGGVVSAFIMGILERNKNLKIIYVSIFGALAHNISQLIVVSFFISHKSILFYFPFLVFFAFITGTFNGILGEWVMNKINAILGG
ncbi:MAG: heptaprenyl diphosphate synthase [Dictyoglomus sp. NZ13-RE01]|nr:MAG: heptaprenyl diphosphate synthase [Dictyoglomus sp. NZ13-RE01]